MKTLIKGGRVLDPASKTDAVKDVLFEDGVILKVAENITDDAENVIDADGMFVMPGLIDLHVHFREPGFEHKETIRTGARAAAAPSTSGAPCCWASPARAGRCLQRTRRSPP